MQNNKQRHGKGLLSGAKNGGHDLESGVGENGKEQKTEPPTQATRRSHLSFIK